MKISSSYLYTIVAIFGFAKVYADYTKEVLTINVSDISDKLYTVEGSTSTIEMQYFEGSASSDYFKGQIKKNSSNVKRIFKDGHIETKARYVLTGTDSSNSPCDIFIEDSGKYSEGQSIITKPIIITGNSKLAFLQTADIQGRVEDLGNGKRTIHIMWNDSNTTLVPYPPVKMPDSSKNYSKEIFTFNINVGGGMENVSGADGAMAMQIGFTCASNTNQFTGKGVDFFYDTRMQFKGQVQTLSARYIMEGKDDEGNNCKVYIENNGIDNNGMVTEPTIVTNNPKWAWIETAPLHGTASFQSGLTIHLFTVNDPSLWSNSSSNPSPSQSPSQSQTQNQPQNQNQNQNQ
ncbi:hypothetical protein U3516DRAFT_892616, partial [Neocallimastix sp. 'constans']